MSDTAASHPGSARPTLDAFVRAAKGGGVPDAAIVPLLRQNGWSERAVYESLGAFYFETLGLRPPSRTGGAANARDAFFYLLYFFTLGCWTLALGNVLYGAIDRAFPDSAYPSYSYASGIDGATSFELATLIVSFAFFVAIHKLIAHEARTRPDAADSGVRSWLTYLALVITSATVIGDGIWFLDQLLSGSLSVRFVLGTILIATIGGGVFAYYLATLFRSTWRLPVTRGISIATFALVAVGLAVGFGLTGDPFHQRAVALDTERAGDLSRIAEGVRERYAIAALPPRLPENFGTAYGTARSILVDPDTSVAYGYTATGAHAYRLCATFATASKPVVWAHGAGHTCYAMTTSSDTPELTR